MNTERCMSYRSTLASHRIFNKNKRHFVDFAFPFFCFACQRKNSLAKKKYQMDHYSLGNIYFVLHLKFMMLYSASTQVFAFVWSDDFIIFGFCYFEISGLYKSLLAKGKRLIRKLKLIQWTQNRPNFNKIEFIETITSSKIQFNFHFICRKNLLLQSILNAKFSCQYCLSLLTVLLLLSFSCGQTMAKQINCREEKKTKSGKTIVRTVNGVYETKQTIASMTTTSLTHVPLQANYEFETKKKNHNQPHAGLARTNTPIHVHLFLPITNHVLEKCGYGKLRMQCFQALISI